MKDSFSSAVSPRQKFRLNPNFIFAQGQNIRIQYIIEYQEKGFPHLFLVVRGNAELDPRSLNVSDLEQANESHFRLESNYYFLHEFIVFLDAVSTDPYGWQYHSDVTCAPSIRDLLVAGDAAFEGKISWSVNPSTTSTSRRRLWFRSYSLSTEVSTLNARLSEAIKRNCLDGETMRGELWKEGHQNKNWKKRTFVLMDNALDYYSGSPSVINIKGSMKIIPGCFVKPLHGLQVGIYVLSIAFIFIVSFLTKLKMPFYIKLQTYLL